MPAKQLIPAHTKNPEADKIRLARPNDGLNVSEFFFDTIQGEGIYAGHPAAFLRLKGCVLNCSWCDTKAVWEDGDFYTFGQLFHLIDSSGLREKLQAGQHLVITGGSPLMQQFSLITFITQFKEEFGFLPFIEVENEVMLKAHSSLIDFVHCWNNSPKLRTSGNPNSFNPEALLQMGSLTNSWFKFVIDDPFDDWEEIEWFVSEGFIKHKHIILMPQGQTREELKENQERVVELAIEKGVIFSNREHIILWDKKTGV